MLIPVLLNNVSQARMPCWRKCFCISLILLIVMVLIQMLREYVLVSIDGIGRTLSIVRPGCRRLVQEMEVITAFLKMHIPLFVED